MKTVNATRIGGIYGIHKVHACSQSELITFEHTALNRSVFAEGSIHAAIWLLKKKKGFFQMHDIVSDIK